MRQLHNGLSFEQLFDPHFLARVEVFSLRVREAQKGGRLAEQRTTARGLGSDFADFKPYVAGDDLRAIDWNIYRRLGKAFVRVFEERQNLPVYCLVDVSRSMFVETPPRIHAAQRCTLALAAAALGQHGTVSLLPFSDDVATQMRGVSGRTNLARIAHGLGDYAPVGRTGLADALARVGGMKLRRGLVMIASDFFDDHGLDGVLHGLERLSHRVMMMQIVRAADADPSLNPDLHGELIIDDGETSNPLAMTLTPDLLQRYRDAYRGFSDRLSGFANASGAGLVRIDADRDVLDQLLPVFGPGGMPL